jgi:hypothetical protein
MSRIIVDRALESWDVYAVPGLHGFSRPARIVFRCGSDPSERARMVEIGGDKAEAEARVVLSTDGELRELLERAEPLG